MTHEDLRAAAPAIFAHTPDPRLSENYAMFRTVDALNALAKENWHPVRAMSKGQRSNRLVAKHLVVLRNPDLPALRGKANDLLHPELIITNSHNGTTAYQVMLGLFRIICSNGLIAADSVFQKLSLRHTPNFLDQMREAAHLIAGSAPALADRIDRFSTIHLTPERKKAFAVAASEIRPFPCEPELLLQPRRHEDHGDDLWTVSNVIQENLVKGGLEGKSALGRRLVSRETKDLNLIMKLNRELWELAERMAA